MVSDEYVSGCYILGGGTTNITMGIRSRCRSLIVKNNYISNVRFGILAEYNAHIYSYNNDDTGNKPAWALFANYNGVIGKYGTQPEGFPADEGSGAGGVIR